MPNPSWPTTLPEYVLERGFGEQLLDQTMESTIEVGPPKVRRRFSKDIRRMTNLQLAMDADQVEIFITFWKDTLKGGSLPFDWVHPRTQAAQTYYFRNPAPVVSGGAGKYYVAFNLETA